MTFTEVEIFSNATGRLNFDYEKLMREEILSDEPDYTTIGFISPNTEIIDFVSLNYGKDLAEFLKKNSSMNNIDSSNFSLSPIIIGQLNKMPENWL